MVEDLDHQIVDMRKILAEEREVVQEVEDQEKEIVIDQLLGQEVDQEIDPEIDQEVMKDQDIINREVEVEIDPEDIKFKYYAYKQNKLHNLQNQNKINKKTI